MNNIAFIDGYLYKEALGKVPKKKGVFKKLYDILYGDLRKQMRREITKGYSTDLPKE